MNKTWCWVLAAAVLSFSTSGCRREPAADSADAVFELFQEPPAEYRSAPLWVWNDLVTKEKIDEQLADFKARGIGGVFVHPRPGLITPYLSEEWLSLCRHAVAAGKALGMKVWIYDENSYPSGFAGGHVPAQMPDAARTGLRMKKAAEIPVASDRAPLAVLRAGADGYEDVTGQDEAGSLGPGEYFIFELDPQQPSPWYGGYTYVDLMRRDVTEKFLDVTLNAYKRVIGEEFGSVVPGVFQDEAEIAPSGKDTIGYTPALFEAFAAKWGYDLKIHLPSLFEDSGDWRKVRHDYYSVLLDLFIQNWAKVYSAYCEANNLAFTGHYWEHEWPIPRIVPDNLAMAAYSHMPGIDILMNEWKTDSHAQFGNDRAVKEIRSAANQMGRKRTMSETYGASGWDLTFFDQKRIGDWEYALGVNFLNQHLSYMTIKGARKRDHPLSFSYHEPWWKAYNLMADYFGRLSVALSAGEQKNEILVLEPTTTAWMYYSPLSPDSQLEAVGDNFQRFIHKLEAAQIEYDLASEATIREFGKARDGKFEVGKRSYGLIVLPPGLENLDSPTVVLLQDYLGQGGRLLAWEGTPKFVDGEMTDRVEKIAVAHAENWIFTAPDAGIGKICELAPPPILFRNAGQEEGLVFHHRRCLEGAELIFLVNSSPGLASSGGFRVRGKSVEKWCPGSGLASGYPFRRDGKYLDVDFSLPPGGSLLLCVDYRREGVAAPGGDDRWTEVPAGETVEIKRLGPNVLTLDYCDLKLDGKTVKDIYFYDAQLLTFKHHGLERNPWDSAVQYKTNIIDLDRFSPDSGFEASFGFVCAGGAGLSTLMAVVERPDLFKVSVNGNEVAPVPGEWKLDKDFGVFDIGAFVGEGRNKIKLRAAPFTIHSELEPVYILGDFSLRPADRGFEIMPDGGIGFGAWPDQGFPFYADGVSYAKSFDLPTVDPLKDKYRVRLGGWLGAVAEIRVGEKTAGYIVSESGDLDITAFLSAGLNTVSVIVYGTLKNTLGPHHNAPEAGRAWPGSFQQGAEGGPPAGSEYSVLGYGLFEDFALQKGTAD
ncbi:MAG: glycosyl hydrolase [Acidobacteriota bacterium]|nr:glycosyl hydrolase [Acidobacteriota bacterium]